MSLNLFAGFCRLLPSGTGPRVQKSFGAHGGPIAAGTLTLGDQASETGQVGPDILGGLVAVCGSDNHRRGVVYTEPAEATLLCRLALAHTLTARLGTQHRHLVSQLVFDVDRKSAAATLASRGLVPDTVRFLRDVRVLDPACGAGQLLVTMFTHLDDLLALLDPATDPNTRRARIIETSLFGFDVSAWALTVTRLRLSLASGGAVDGDSRFRLEQSDFLLDESATAFNLLVSNPPYVRHEQIRDPDSRLTPGAYKDAILARTMKQLPAMFARQKLSRACDLYVYFYLLGLARLKPDGVMSVVSSSSWLDVAFAADLRRTLANRLALVIDHDQTRSFAAADVNTTIALLSAATTSNTTFVRVHVPFSQLKPEHLAQGRRVSASDLASHSRSGWGARFLRASAAFSQLASNMVPLGKQFAVGRGRRTGHDAFFYLTAADIERFAIEPRFLQPIIKSPSEFVSQRQTATLSARKWVFVCGEPLDQLAGTGAAAYIAHMAPETHQLKDCPAPNLLLPIAFHDRYFVAINNADWQVHQRFATLRLPQNQRPLIKVLAAILSGNVLALFAETVGRHSLGQGALDIPPKCWQQVPFPDLTRLGTDQHDELVTLWDDLADRAPARAHMAARDPVCQRIDHIVCELAGISPNVLDAVAHDRLALLEKRLSKATKNGKNV